MSELKLVPVEPSEEMVQVVHSNPRRTAVKANNAQGKQFQQVRLALKRTQADLRRLEKIYALPPGKLTERLENLRRLLDLGEQS